MSQHDYVLANAAGSAFRSDLNNALAAIVGQNSGATEPATMFAYMWWADTTTGWLKQRNAANSAWIYVAPLAGHSEASVASATTTNLGGQTSDLVLVTGTTTITGFGTADAGRVVLVRHSGALTLTHNASSLILPGAANITTAAGDTYEAQSLGAGNWVVRAYQKASGQAVVASAGTKVQDFRLTLTTGLPVTTTDVTGASTLYACPKTGNQISLYDGATWNTRTSAQFSIALSGLTSGKPYDVFCYDNAGTPTLELLVWTNDTTRATALTYQDGILVKSGGGVATYRRYMGTIYTTGTTTTEDSEANRYVWNYYHRVKRAMKRAETSATFAKAASSYAQANSSTANQLNYVVGLGEDNVEATLVVNNYGAVGARAFDAIGVDSTTVASSPVGRNVAHTLNEIIGTCTQYVGNPGAGKHALTWIGYYEISGLTVVGTGASASGINGSLLA